MEEPTRATDQSETVSRPRAGTVWTSEGITDYRQALEEALRFPARAEGIVVLFTVGIIFNYLTVIDDGSREMGLLIMLPALAFFGYLAAVGAQTAQGSESPPTFPLDVSGIKRLLRDGAKPVAVAFVLLFPMVMILGVLMVPVVLLLGEWVIDPAATIVAIPIFLAFLVFLPAVLVHSGFDEPIRKAFSGKSLDRLLDVVFTKAYLEALVGFVVILTVANAIVGVLNWVPVIGGLIGAALMFYAQLMVFYILGRTYRVAIDNE